MVPRALLSVAGEFWQRLELDVSTPRAALVDPPFDAMAEVHFLKATVTGIVLAVVARKTHESFSLETSWVLRVVSVFVVSKNLGRSQVDTHKKDPRFIEKPLIICWLIASKRRELAHNLKEPDKREREGEKARAGSP